MSDVKPVAWMYPSDLVEFEGSETFANAWSLEVTNVDSGEGTAPLYSQETVTALQAEIVALRKDAERLEVLLKAITPSGQLICGCYDPEDGACDWSFIDGIGKPLIGFYDTPREAIDALAAIAKERS